MDILGIKFKLMALLIKINQFNSFINLDELGICVLYKGSR